MADEVEHLDEPGREVTMPDGRVVRNLTAEEYAATYADGEPCSIVPPEALAAAVAAAVAANAPATDPAGGAA